MVFVCGRTPDRIQQRSAREKTTPITGREERTGYNGHPKERINKKKQTEGGGGKKKKIRETIIKQLRGKGPRARGKWI